MRRKPLQARSRALVDAVVEATAHVLRTEGAEAATTNHIAARAGVSIGSIYQYFPNKQALYDELTQRHIRALERKVEELWPLVRALPIDQIFRVAVEGLLSLLQVDPRLHSQLQRAALVGRAHPTFRAFHERLERETAELFTERGHELPIPPRDPAVSAALLCRIVAGAVEATLISSPEQVRDPAFVDELVGFVEARFGL